MNFKKVITTIVSVMLSLTIAFQTSTKENIILVASTLNNPFFVTLKEGALQKANELGYDLVVLDSQNNPAKELANVEDTIIKGNKIILINPTDSDSDAVGNTAVAANKAGIPVITLDRANGMNVMLKLLIAHPSVQAVFAENDKMALGAARNSNSRT